jgi:hypothetical protein
MTGYMFCNGWYRLQLAQSMGSLTSGNTSSSGTSSGTALVSTASFGSIDDEVSLNTTTTTLDQVPATTPGPLSNSLLAAGSQKLRVEGEVLKWHHEDGVQQVPALQYIEQLEEELQVLQRQLAAAQAAAEAAAAAAAAASAAHAGSPSQPRSAIHETGQNELLEYLKGLSGEQVAELTDCATPDVLESMNALVKRMIGNDGDNSDMTRNSNGSARGGGEWGSGKSECTATELAQLLCWLMSVGHQLRTMEVRLSLLQSFENGPESGADDGANDGDAASEWVPRLPPGR